MQIFLFSRYTLRVLEDGKKTTVNFFWYAFKYQFEHFKHQHICQKHREMSVLSRQEKGKLKEKFLKREKFWNSELSEDDLAFEEYVFRRKASHKYGCVRIIWAQLTAFFFHLFRSKFLSKNRSKMKMFSYILRQHGYLIIHSRGEIFNYCWWLYRGCSTHTPIHSLFFLFVSKDSKE